MKEEIIMIKFEVYLETIETRKGTTDWSVQDMKDAALRETCRYPELLKSFLTKEEAKKYFEAEKNNCRSYYQEAYACKIVKFDYLELCENEYDEDDEFIQGDCCDIYVAPTDEEIAEELDEIGNIEK